MALRSCWLCSSTEWHRRLCDFHSRPGGQRYACVVILRPNHHELSLMCDLCRRHSYSCGFLLPYMLGTHEYLLQYSCTTPIESNFRFPTNFHSAAYSAQSMLIDSCKLAAGGAAGRLPRSIERQTAVVPFCRGVGSYTSDETDGASALLAPDCLGCLPCLVSVSRSLVSTDCVVRWCCALAWGIFYCKISAGSRQDGIWWTQSVIITPDGAGGRSSNKLKNSISGTPPMYRTNVPTRFMEERLSINKPKYIYALLCSSNETITRNTCNEVCGITVVETRVTAV